MNDKGSLLLAAVPVCSLCTDTFVQIQMCTDIKHFEFLRALLTRLALH